MHEKIWVLKYSSKNFSSNVYNEDLGIEKGLGNYWIIVPILQFKKMNTSNGNWHIKVPQVGSG